MMMTTVEVRPTRFDALGQLVASAGVTYAIEHVPCFLGWVNKRLHDYAHCRWGDVPAQDREMNDKAVLHGDDRVVARYNCTMDSDLVQDIYIITEWDRSSTTVLFCSEY